MLLFALIASCLTSWNSERSSPPRAANGLELRLHVSHFKGGLPQTLSFTLTNHGPVAIHLPQPHPADFEELELGSVLLCTAPTFRLPSSTGVPGKGLRFGALEIGATGDLPSALFRARYEWRVLYPEESLTVSVPNDAVPVPQRDLVTVKYWGSYAPPDLAQAERESLSNAGIRFPSELLESAQVTYRVRHDRRRAPSKPPVGHNSGDAPVAPPPRPLRY